MPIATLPSPPPPSSPSPPVHSSHRPICTQSPLLAQLTLVPRLLYLLLASLIDYFYQVKLRPQLTRLSLPTFIAVCLTILLTIFTFWSFFHLQPPTIAPTALVQTTALHQPANLDLSASQLTVITGSDYATTQQQIALGLQLQPQHFQLLLNAALIATQQGEVVTAQNYLDQAQAVSPNSPLFITP